MPHDYDHKKIRDILLQHAEKVKEDYAAPWLDQRPLTMRNANKFFLGAIIDYRTRADVAWANARRFSEVVLGDPPRLWNHIVETYTREEWASKRREFQLHRWKAAHDRVWRIGHDVVERYDGDARNIWQGNNAETVCAALDDMRCGRKITDMTVGFLIGYGHIQGIGDVAADTHVCKVLGMVFYASPDLDPESARRLARKIHPDNPWELDLALHDIGKTHCEPPGQPGWCYCDECPLGIGRECEGYREGESDQS